MWLDILVRFLHISGAAFWVGGSAALRWAWLPALRTTTNEIQLLTRAISSLQWIFRLAALLLLISGGYRASAVGTGLPLDRRVGVLLMIGLWIVLTGLYEMAFARARRRLAALKGDSSDNTPEFTATLVGLERLSALTLWLGLLLLLDGAYLVAG